MINQPSNQIKLTNVSVVRLKKAGKRFEIACYKNKAREWRSGVETDLSEVIQIEQIFANVSKGAVSPAQDLKKAFGTTDVQEILLQILKKGELQVGEKERAHEIDAMRREIALATAERCVDPETQRPITVTMIEKVMDQLGYAVHTNKSIKSQALELIKQIQSESALPIQRAQMRIRLTLPVGQSKTLKGQITPLCASIEAQETNSSEWEIVALIDPGSFKIINELIHASAGPKGELGKLETLSFAAISHADGEDRIE
ncbi:uncharacterized protein L969DRAFT_95297 [Mixia osmundae IAM 14324]|uniref:Ribosome maturation protein SDO1 n=1 Tax=Mixia osmundae (strain CBS 9802 / IAM 14324 / JCM 22182 / KY 12970) TaxID=764103 RepID=G7EAL9_MIXOS|nr:uncharacterized protein L969DRAFT_95297 [Mixia osmundae IAM 14324]KEI38198.1 hypothetical protein L969DRAFT_95297 [Mixia osmundae IAM 14324]GAA99879.1 hypothetical protein E5Q_06582 [Mixia osmundae IAM 14324]